MPHRLHPIASVRLAGLALLTLLAATPVFAQGPAVGREFLARPGGRGGPVVNPGSCSGGLRYDDGSFEGAVGFANANLNGAYVMAFDLPPRLVVNDVCLCWTRTEFSNGTAVDFNVVFYGTDGEDGAPGTLLGRVPARAENVPDFVASGVALYRVPLGALPFSLPSRVYIGAEWEPFVNRQFFVCNDSTASTPLNEAWSSTDGVDWVPTSEIRPSYRALGVIVYGTQIALPVPLTAVALAMALGVLGVALAMRRRRQRATRSGGG